MLLTSTAEDAAETPELWQSPVMQGVHAGASGIDGVSASVRSSNPPAAGNIIANGSSLMSLVEQQVPSHHVRPRSPSNNTMVAAFAALATS